jgi:hypothetical protein
MKKIPLIEEIRVDEGLTKKELIKKAREYAEENLNLGDEVTINGNVGYFGKITKNGVIITKEPVRYPKELLTAVGTTYDHDIFLQSFNETISSYKDSTNMPSYDKDEQSPYWDAIKLEAGYYLGNWEASDRSNASKKVQNMYKSAYKNMVKNFDNMVFLKEIDGVAINFENNDVQEYIPFDFLKHQ